MLNSRERGDHHLYNMEEREKIEYVAKRKGGEEEEEEENMGG